MLENDTPKEMLSSCFFFSSGPLSHSTLNPVGLNTSKWLFSPPIAQDVWSPGSPHTCTYCMQTYANVRWQRQFQSCLLIPSLLRLRWCWHRAHLISVTAKNLSVNKKTSLLLASLCHTDPLPPSLPPPALAHHLNLSRSIKSKQLCYPAANCPPLWHSLAVVSSQ